ncbi:MAG: PorP/SprF family type IX secretion system membrane protein [Bacteroidetes bacterium]|nr:PorP/SprF family type IX secretion system membrane protein [Bacteroidota bacterium]
MKRIVGFLAGILLLSASARAQQQPLGSHYLVNLYSLNPVFAGQTYDRSFFMNYRRDWVGIPGSPTTIQINGHRKLVEGLHLGGSLLGDQADIFYRLRAGLSLTYRLQTGDGQYLSVGLGGNMFQSLIRIDRANVDLQDPVLRDLDRLLNTSFNVSFGLSWSYDNFFVGAGSPLVLRTREAYYTGVEGLFAYERAWDVFTGHRFDIDGYWEFSPMLLYRKTINQPSTFDFSTMFSYDQRLWLGALYRTTGLFGLSVGGRVFDRTVFHYTYEAGIGGINLGSGGSHEISIGFTSLAAPDNTGFKKNNRHDAYQRRPARQTDRQTGNQQSVRNQSRQNVRKNRSNNHGNIRIKPYQTPLQPRYAPYEKF